MLKFRKNGAENLDVTGLEINPAITSIPLVKGWNDIAYLLRTDAAISVAIDEVSIPTGDAILKGQTGSAIYYEGSGWVGELDTLRVLHGYKLNVQGPGNLSYDPAGSSKKSSDAKRTSPENQDRASSFASPEGQNRLKLLAEYGLSPEDYENSATLIAEAVNEDGENLAGPGDLIMAYQGDEIRGIAKASYVPALDKYLFIMTFFSNKIAEELQLRIRFIAEAIENRPELLLNFHPDEIIGEPHHPEQILVEGLALESGDLQSLNPGAFLTVYPNPASHELTVSSSVPIEGIRIYTLTGEKITSVDRTGYSIRINVEDLLPGIYTLETITGKEVITRKFIITTH
jgi:hypothetical protein